MLAIPHSIPWATLLYATDVMDFLRAVLTFFKQNVGNHSLSGGKSAGCHGNLVVPICNDPAPGWRPEVRVSGLSLQSRLIFAVKSVASREI